MDPDWPGSSWTSSSSRLCPSEYDASDTMPRDAEASNLGTGTHYSLELGVGIRFLWFF